MDDTRSNEASFQNKFLVSGLLDMPAFHMTASYAAFSLFTSACTVRLVAGLIGIDQTVC
jgi:hypothetical protein